MKQEIGALLHLHVDEIEPLFATKSHQFLVAKAAESINLCGGRNWIPLVVKQTGESSFVAVANIFTLAAVRQAGLTKIWCIVADDDQFVQQSSQLLSKEIVPKVNLTTATRDEIKLALDYLINRSVNPLSGVKVATSLDKISNAERKYWQESLKDVVALKCGITNGKKLDIFKEIFYVTPEPRLISDDDLGKSGNDLKKLSVTGLRKIAKERGHSGYSKMKKAELLILLADTEES
ncbi:slr0106 [Synechocystis sp. PCC 6803]|uniref:Slr0106 protein n=1 Tax=Synechocystis sp. (strain ATCC 27184 / PCC 6803 / Kazusa) TaxID=1111708 RepID=Q55877_SYNY3|nr:MULTISPECIES: Rho termination factor N-terminal domain-containing protein [unclassified Synechocystis]BAM53766.1 hypothetical protein BEST7613_4835 [Synechocystis sp. PCC 6803] [Bacillus subtilis BEST7613]AGF52930.1 hypothetical protein MYO_127010 [Synechocystis sp. PCC 6803]ALJ68826.1 transcription termination factor rho family protein [Synechocystis sp. PCC 6803]AVP90688.1 transcription termination factor rho family protein [Synechocystis sp. IPPAS B-1465]MBD2618856.1 transcription termin